MNDLISRQVNDAHNEGYDVGYWAGRRDYEPKWIPVTGRLPEVDENVLVSYHLHGESEFFPSHNGVTISYWTGVKNHNIPYFGDLGDASTVLAWMPLPEPYRKETEDAEMH